MTKDEIRALVKRLKNRIKVWAEICVPETPGVLESDGNEPMPAMLKALKDATAALEHLSARVKALEAERDVLRQDVIAFCGPWAANYARDHSLPKNHLHPAHYDILERCGARMVDFIRDET